MTKAEINALEKIFAAEIDGRLPFQSRAKIYQALVDQGLVAPMEWRVGTGPFACTVKGYQLTHAGRFLYCDQC